MRAWAWRVRAATGLAASDVGAAANTRLRLCECEAAVVLEAAVVAADARQLAVLGLRRRGGGHKPKEEKPHGLFAYRARR